MNLKRVRVLVGLTALAGPTTFLNGAGRGAQSQAAPASPTAFDVASIKLTKPGVRGYSILPTAGRLTTSNATLKMLVAAAYHVYDFQVSGGPKWLDSERYDIEGKTAGETSPTKAQLMGMLQKLLADRF